MGRCLAKVVFSNARYKWLKLTALAEMEFVWGSNYCKQHAQCYRKHEPFTWKDKAISPKLDKKKKKKKDTKNMSGLFLA